MYPVILSYLTCKEAQTVNMQWHIGHDKKNKDASWSLDAISVIFRHGVI